jgi:hypothetical protein
VADDNVVDFEKKRSELLKSRVWGLLEKGDLLEAQRVLNETIAANAGHAVPQPVPLDKLLDSAVARAKLRSSGEERPVETPWRALNNTLGGGLWPGAHFLVAGTGVGKSQLTFQIARHVAKEGTPVGLIALELDDMQLALRLASEEAGVTWSRVYNGQASAEEMRRIELQIESVRKFPVLTDFGQAMGWPSTRIDVMARALREKHPDGPALMVLDFVQLVSADEGGRPVDLRERIGIAGYRARTVAKDYKISIIVISSTSRDRYALLNSSMKKLGLGLKQRGQSTYRVCRRTDDLIGCGKESGELEYAADSVHVLVKPELVDSSIDPAIAEIHAQDGSIVVCASVKTRASIPSWFALNFQGGRFHELPDHVMNTLAMSSGKESSAETNPDEYMVMVVKAIKQASERGHVMSTAKQIKDLTGGRETLVREALSRALREGFLERADPIDPKSAYVFKRSPEPPGDAEYKSEEL